MRHPESESPDPCEAGGPDGAESGVVPSDEELTFEIRVRGDLTDRVVEAIGGSRPSSPSTSVLVTVPDTAALNALILRLEDLALELLSVSPVGREADQ